RRQLDDGRFLPAPRADHGNARSRAPGSRPSGTALRAMARAGARAERRNVAAFLVLRPFPRQGGAGLGAPRSDRDPRGYGGRSQDPAFRRAAPATAAALASGSARRPRAGTGSRVGDRGPGDARTRGVQTEEKTMKKLGLPVAISLLAPAFAGAEVETMHGYRIADPYRHFETDEGADPWIAEQHEVTEAYLRAS